MAFTFNVDFSASAQFKGHNQKPLWLAQLRGLYSPSLMQITNQAIRRGLDMVVLRSYSHPEGTDNRWQSYLAQADCEKGFTTHRNGVITYRNFYRPEEKPLYIVHGQGLQTNRGDIQVLFANREIGKRKPNYNSDFDYLLKEARNPENNGENVLITASKPHLWREEDLRKVDAIEVHNGVDFLDNKIKTFGLGEHNIRVFGLSRKLRIPGITVSNSKCLADLGTSYTRFRGDLQRLSPYGPEELSEVLKKELKADKYSATMNLSALSWIITGLAILELKATGNKD